MSEDQAVRGKCLEGAPDNACADSLKGAQLGDRRQLVALGEDPGPDGRCEHLSVTPNEFASLGQLSATLLGFVDRYNQTARPFSWKFTASDLHDLMDRISRHEQQDDPQAEPLPEAA